ncbi:large-conductance mechanosensitive channel protein MscL [Sporichthya brevicatena]|uniref:Large-conductance mechanosensitive channel n=1 Tax=Sporichthya brevicatena TaxID=171442 RepID=A0ABP3R576_9ACTN
MIKGFRDFLMRGNVADLAVAVVIGTAFTALVTAFTTSFIEPIIKVVMGGGLTGGTVKLDDENRLLFGDFANALITFVITAAVVYFIFVLPLKTLNEKRQRGEVAEPEPAAIPDDILLLQEIRDLLANRAPGSGSIR